MFGIGDWGRQGKRRACAAQPTSPLDRRKAPAKPPFASAEASTQRLKPASLSKRADAVGEAAHLVSAQYAGNRQPAQVAQQLFGGVCRP